LEEYKKCVKKIVERYDGDDMDDMDDMPGLGYGIKYWTIGNEVEDPKQFHGTGEDYAELLKASYVAIKEADPDAKVLISAPDDVGPEVLETKFWKDVFLSDVKGFFDYGNIHYNVGRSGIDENGFEDLSRGFRVYKNFLKSYGVTGIKIFGTEISPAPGELEIDEKANLWVIGSVKAFYEGAAGIKYPLVFLEDEKMLRVFLTMSTLFKNFDKVEKINEGCYEFDINNSTLYVVWFSGELPDDLTGKVYVSDIYGNVEETNADSIILSETPVYMTKDKKIMDKLKEKLSKVKKLKSKIEKIMKSAKSHAKGKIEGEMENQK